MMHKELQNLDRISRILAPFAQDVTRLNMGGLLFPIGWWGLLTLLVTLAKPVLAQNGVTVAGGNGGGSAPNQLYEPTDLVLDKAGNIYIADPFYHRIQKWAPGAVTGTTVAGGNGFGSAANQLHSPDDVAIDEVGNLYIADNQNYRVQKWTPGAATGSTVAGGHGAGMAANQLSYPTHVAVDAAGNVYVTDTFGQRIQKWAPGASSGVTVAGGNGRGGAANQLDYPEGITVDKAGNIYIADAGNFRIQKWAPGASSGITVAGGNGQGFAANQLSDPFDIALDASGNMYIVDSFRQGIQKWVPGASSGITVAGGNGQGSAANQLYNPTGVTLDDANNIYVTDSYNHRVQKFSPSPSFAISGVNTLDCQVVSPTERLVTFSPQYTGLTGQPITFAVAYKDFITTQAGPYSRVFPLDQPLIPLIADQQGVVSSFNYQWLNACQVPAGSNQPPTSSGIPDQSDQQGQSYQLTLTSYFTDPEQQSLSFSISGLPAGLSLSGNTISGQPQVTGSWPINVTAQDPGGLSVSTSFLLTVTSGPSQAQPFALVGVNTLDCQIVSPTERLVTFMPQYTGQNGHVITFAAAYGGFITQQAGPYSRVFPLREPLIPLIASQDGVTSSFNYQWQAACGSSARLAATEPIRGKLQVKLLGNPVVGSEVLVEVRGAEDQPLRVELMDLQGRLVSELHMGHAESVETCRLSMNGSVSNRLLVRVSTPTQSQAMQVVRVQ
ncbi:SBBP repeat-containing protein [Spirosoma gilvum]